MPEEDEAEKIVNEFQERLQSGVPLTGFYVDEPTMWVAVTVTGELAIRWAYEVAGFDTAATMEIRLTPAAAQKLKAILVNAENIPDTLPSEGGARTKCAFRRIVITDSVRS